MTEEEVKGLLKEASEKIKDDFIPSMTNLLMDVFQHGLNKGTEIGVKIGSDKSPFPIKWKTGKPKERGEYLVTLLSGKVKVAEFYKYKVADKEYWDCIPYGIVGVKAWCKLSDIEPYKEETK